MGSVRSVRLPPFVFCFSFPPRLQEDGHLGQVLRASPRGASLIAGGPRPPCCCREGAHSGLQRRCEAAERLRARCAAHLPGVGGGAGRRGAAGERRLRRGHAHAAQREPPRDWWREQTRSGVVLLRFAEVGALGALLIKQSLRACSSRWPALSGGGVCWGRKGGQRRTHTSRECAGAPAPAEPGLEETPAAKLDKCPGCASPSTRWSCTTLAQCTDVTIDTSRTPSRTRTLAGSCGHKETRRARQLFRARTHAMALKARPASSQVMRANLCRQRRG